MAYDSLVEFEGLAYYRKRIDVDMGSTSSEDGQNPKALIQMAQEVVSNSIDEALSGHGDKIEITIHKDNSMTVSDHGRGIPRDLRRRNKKTGEFETIKYQSAIGALTRKGVGGKFSNKDYKAGTGGRNAIGLKGTTSGSEFVIVEAQTTQGEHYRIRIDYDKFILNDEPTSVEDLKFIKKNGTGTSITFMPDKRVLSSVDWQVDLIENRYEMSSFLVPGVLISLTDERKVDENGQPYHKEWLSKRGFSDYVAIMAKGLEPINGFYEIEDDKKVFKSIPFNKTVSTGIEGPDGDTMINVHGDILWVDNNGTDIQTFANGIPTLEHGPHLNGMKSGIKKAINDFVEDKRLLKRGQSFDADDIYEGLIGAIEVKIPENILEFEGQTKEKLGTASARKAAQDVVYEALTKWLYDNSGKDNNSAIELVERMVEAKAAREAANSAREEVKEARKAKQDSNKDKKLKLEVSSKLVKATEGGVGEKELFIVEGDSAAGTIKQGGFNNQAVFPLRGKILNTLELDQSRVLKNKEVSTIAAVLGSGIASAFDPKEMVKNSGYGKIVLASDADDDGYHIQCLAITLFAKWFPGLIEDGHLFVAQPPLFKIKRMEKGENINEYAYSEEERDAIVKKLKKVTGVTRFKGLGEASANDLRKTVMDSKTRHLIQLTMDDAKESMEMLRVAMGNDNAARSEWVREESVYENEV